MLGKKGVKMDKIDTLIGKNTKFEGTITSKGTVRLDGELVGDMISEGNIVIGEAGKVKGNITCHSIIVSGTVEGNVICKEQLRLTNTASLYGDIEVKSFIVDENAVFEGSCKMREDSNSKEKKNKTKEKQGA
jgi:cytoskeletal protein CcmA (bactofilin family)